MTKPVARPGARLRRVARDAVPTPLQRPLQSLLEGVRARVKPTKIDRYLAAGSLADVSTQLAETHHYVDKPVVMVSQVQRSGGSLFSQLFDGHAELLAHPSELKIGYPDKGVWPPIDPALPADKNFKYLFEIRVSKVITEGYTKKLKADWERHNFFLFPQVQRSLFASLWEQRPPETQRDILDIYFTSYFNSWLNYRGSIERARFVTGFVATLLYDERNMEAFHACYPDGYLICVVRSPRTWYPSAKNHSKALFDTVGEAIALWTRSTEAALREKGKHPDRVILIDFVDLIERTEAVMRLVARTIGISYEDILSRPTFNGNPIGANTSFGALSFGEISDAPIKRDALLTAEERRVLDETCGQLYARAMTAVSRP